ncbi:ER membrane protein complex subunit 1 [Parasteatoda tepidariorum]|uniref:ER membrane protein complex subunit 1 n=1 Tax=Parasteatoda tepidariorum TaxID=114398 RepID=UPI00077FE4CF|nr:ER membrane protein complex subunit 1-like [Parasteatoda tepidariorum]
MALHHYLRIFLNLYLYTTLFTIVSCLYEDQVGKFDWKQQYIGKVKFTYIDPTVGGLQKFVVATEENVLACLSTRSGSIVWRQILENEKNGEINAMSHDGDLITVNGGGQFIRSWDPNTGVLQWETPFPHIQKKTGINFFEISPSSREVILVEMITKQQAQVSVYGFTRASLKTSDVIPAPWFDKNTQCKFISSSYFACLDSKKENIYLISIKDSGSFIPVSLKSLGIEVSENIQNINIITLPYQGTTEKPVFALQLDGSGILLKIEPPGLKLVKLLPNLNKLTSTLIDDRLTLFSINLVESTFKIKAADIDVKSYIQELEGEYSLTEDRGKLESIFILPYTKRDAKKDYHISYKMLLLFEDYSILMVHRQGRINWSREEALSCIVSSEIMDLPLSDMDASIEQEFSQPDAGLISMLLTRLKSQVYLFQTALLQAVMGFKGDGISMGGDKKTLTRDTFGLHKIIVVLTKPGKTFGIDNLSGLIIWSHYEKELSPFYIGDSQKPYFSLFVQRTTAHFPYPPVCTTVGQHLNSKKSRVYSFNPITGKTLESRILTFQVKQIMPMGSLDHYLRPILLLDSNNKVHIYPEVKEIFSHTKSHYFFTADQSSGTLTGYSIVEKNNDLAAIEMWKVKLPNKIVTVVTKNPQEHVHSQGRVMGDRSVLYKYLNPNLAAVFTVGMDSMQKTFCNLYLVDVITGLVVYTASHKRCRPPIHVVHSENWVVYSFYNEKSRRMEISSLELFEGMYQSNTTAFSSFAPPPLPLIEHQTFIFPNLVISMADTITERGMTSKHILIVLPSGGILELPKTFLDPRRPIHPLPEHREEGLIPYIPELPVMAEGIINYNQSVMQVKGITTAPSGLESTCLVFVYGLDLFYTRVTPSKTFDILKDDFDHYLISVVLLGLLILSYTTKRLAARKTLRAAWK